MTGPRRIAYVINSLEGGGAASPLPDILRVLRETGAEVRLFVLTMRNGRALPPVRAAGFEPLVRAGGEKDHLAAFRWLCRELRSWGATHLWTSLSRATLLGQLAGTRLGIPVVSWQHNAFLKPWNERLLRWNRNRSAIWVADSEEVARLTADRLRIPADRLVTWPIFFADPQAPVAAPWQPGETLRLGSLGRLHPAKGYDLLIAALARLRDDGFEPPVPFRIAIAGEGNTRDALIRQAREADIDCIDWTGFTDRPRDFLAGLHLYLQPSRREGFCIALHEAIQAGLPVLASATGEMPFTVEDGVTGRIVRPRDVTDLASALSALLSSPEKLAGMGRIGRERLLQRYSRERFAAIGASIVARLS